MSYSIDAITDNCYEGTSCLINKLDIRDEKQLDVVEAQITVAKISMLQQNPIDGNFNFEHYKAIHIFEDLYDWAGIPRVVDISKKGTLFVAAKNIDEIATACFERLKNQNYFKDLDTDELMVATIQAANGVDTCLRDVLREIIKPIEPDFSISMQ